MGIIFLSPIILQFIVPLHFRSNHTPVAAFYLKRFLYHLTLLQRAQPGYCSSDKDYFLNYCTLIIAFTLAAPVLFNQARFNTKKSWFAKRKISISACSHILFLKVKFLLVGTLLKAITWLLSSTCYYGGENHPAILSLSTLYITHTLLSSWSIWSHPSCKSNSRIYFLFRRGYILFFWYQNFLPLIFVLLHLVIAWWSDD